MDVDFKELAKKNRHKSDDIEPISACDPHPFYPDAAYTARCIHAVVYKDPRFRSWKVRLDFQILDRDDWELPVCKFFNLGTGPQPLVALGSHYRRAWIRANGNKPPKRSDRMSPRIFVGQTYLIRVGTNYLRWESADGVRHEHGEGEQYSTVKELIELLP